MSPIGETTKLSTECILVSMSSSFRFKFELLWFYVIFCKNLCFSSLNDLAHAPAVFFKKKTTTTKLKEISLKLYPPEAKKYQWVGTCLELVYKSVNKLMGLP